MGKQTEISRFIKKKKRSILRGAKIKQKIFENKHMGI